MRRALTLLELIFTIVIIAMVFTVIPKVIYSFNKADTFSMREDALFNGLSDIKLITQLPWDQNNTEYNDILHTDSNQAEFECNDTTKRRVGGFIGSRNCEHNLSASAISSDGESDKIYYNDIDDFNDINVSVDLGVDNIYTISNEVSYMSDAIFNYDYTNQSVTVNLANTVESTPSTNIKEVRAEIYYTGKRGGQRELSRFYYYSTNIGQVLIKKRSW